MYRAHSSFHRMLFSLIIKEIEDNLQAHFITDCNPDVYQNQQGGKGVLTTSKYLWTLCPGVTPSYRWLSLKAAYQSWE